MNIPTSRMSQGGWMTAGWYSGAPNIYTFNNPSWGNILSFGKHVANDYPYAAILKAEEAWNIDTKMDDGLAARGKIWAQYYTTCTNGASQTDYAATYLLSSSGVVCSLTFAQVF